MDGVEYDNWDVFLEQRKQEPGWQWPLNLAIVLHLAVFAGSFILPDYLERKPHFDNIVTVSLISMPEPAPAAPLQLKASAVEPEITAVREKEAAPEPRQQKEAAVAKTSEPKKMVAQEPEIIAEPPVASAPEVVPEPTAVQVAPPISLNPVKRKITVAKDTRLAEERAMALETEKKKKVAEAETAEKKRLAKKEEQDKQAEKSRLAEAEQRKKEKKAVEAKKMEKKRIAEKKEQDKQAEKSRLAEAEQRKKEKKAVEAKKTEKKRIAEKERARTLQRKKVAQDRQKKALSEAKQMERQAEQAQREAAKARQKLALLRGDAEAVDSTLSGNGTVAGGTGGASASPVVISQYTASLNGRISTHWKLPAMVTVNRKLKTMVALTVRRDGSIEDMRIERKSGDPFFDQSVMKALRSAEPLPDFPALITEQALEFALNFTPQGLAL